MTPVRNATYILHHLTGGSRFYFKGDRKKTVYQLITGDPFEVKKQAGFHVSYANALDSNAQAVQFKANREVIYLRNINDEK